MWMVSEGSSQNSDYLLEKRGYLSYAYCRARGQVMALVSANDPDLEAGNH